jgi:hypothetical protein
MASSFRIDVYDLAGVQQYVLTDNLWLSYLKRRNSPGAAELGIAGDHPLLSEIEDNWQFEIWRRGDEIPWYRDFIFLFRDLEWEQKENPEAILSGPGLISKLESRIIAWPSMADNRTKFLSQPAETIAKNLVEYNVGPSATVVNGRDKDGTITGLSVAPDASNGNQLSVYCARSNLLSTLQEIAEIGGGDFSLDKTSTISYEFNWHDGQLGIDRRDNVIFSMARGNMENPRYNKYNSIRKTAAIVAGQGEKEDREIELVYSNDYNSLLNDYEIFVDARDIEKEEINALITRGEEELSKNKTIEEFTFDVLQTKDTSYGKEYFLGDLVSVINPYKQTKLSMIIDRISIAWESDGAENIEVGMELI